MSTVLSTPSPSATAVDRRVAPKAPQRRIRLPLLVSALAAALLAAVLVLYGLSAAADRTEVLHITRDVAAGETITADAVAPVGVAVDGSSRLVPAASRDEIVGQLATKAMAPGDLVSRTDIADVPLPLDGEQRVGAVLTPGRYPPDLRRGDRALATPIEGDGTNVVVRVLDLRPARDGIEVALAAPADAGAAIAQLAAQNRLVLVGEPRP
jgi:hypothetical protein